jgi:predicted ATPase/DNA-binding SARP family transcriptional activator
MRFRLLGPLEIEVEGEPFVLAGRQQRVLLLQLLLRPNAAVPGSVLIDRLWPAGAPRTATTALRVLLSQLRKALGGSQNADAPLLEHIPGAGWVIHVEPGGLDISQFESAIDTGWNATRDGDDATAVLAWRTGLSLWRGPALDGLADEFDEAMAVAARLEELRLSITEQCVEAELRLGRHATLVHELESLVADHPLHERLVAALMVALYRSGRQVDALRVFAQTRRALVDELGIEPSDRLALLEHAILEHDQSLELAPPINQPLNGERAVGPGATASGDRLSGSAPTLPAAATSFVGREEQLAAVGELLRSARLVSFIGPGGCGKTRLAIEVARRERERASRLVAFADLSTVAEPELVDGIVPAAFGIPGQRAATPESLCNHLADADVLLVLDNCEHVIEAAAALTAVLTTRCPRVKIIATSREVLEVDGEHVFPVPPLSLPEGMDLTWGEIAVKESVRADILSAEAVQLFVQRARAARAQLELDDASLLAVAAICRRLDGIPLAIELIAPLVATLSLVEIASRVEGRIGLVSQARRRGVARQATLEAVVAWSYRLLEEPEQDLFRRMSVFVGDFDIEALESISTEKSRPNAAETLILLVKKSMVAMLPNSGSDAPRYRLLETLRTFALDKLVASADEAEVRHRHALHYLAVAERADKSVHGPEARRWLSVVERDLANLHAALAWSFEGGDQECAIRLAGSVHWFFGGMGHLDQLCSWLDEVLEHPDGLVEELLLLAVSARNTLAFSTGNYLRASELGEQAIELSRKLGDRRQLLIALVVRGGIGVYEGNAQRAADCFIEAAVLCEELGDSWAKGWLLTGQGIAARRDGNREASERTLRAALDIFRGLGNNEGQVLPLINLAMLAQSAGKFDVAVTRCQEAAAAAERIGHRQLLHVTMCTLGRVHLDRGDVPAARQLLMHALQGYKGAEHWLTVAIAIEGLAIVAEHRGRGVDAAVLLGYACQLRATYHIPLSQDRLREQETLLQRLDERIGFEARDRAMSVGAGFSLPEATERAADATVESVTGSMEAAWNVRSDDGARIAVL